LPLDDYLKWRIFHTPPFWSEPPNAFDMDHPPPSIPSTIVRGDYTPPDQFVGQRYVPPSCLWYLLIHLALVLVMVLLHPHNAVFVAPLMALIPLVGTIYVFNLRRFRKWKIPNVYWNLVQLAGPLPPSSLLTSPFAVLSIYSVTLVFFFIGPRPHFQSSDGIKFEKFIDLPVGRYKL
jgi:hypothetical protein